MRGGLPEERRRIPGGVPQVGGAGDGDRRGHRRRPAADHLARRDGGRRAAAHRSSRRSGISAPGRPPRYAGRAERRPLGQAVTAGHRRRAARDFACVTWQPAPVQPRVHHRAVRPLCARQHGARRARRRRHAAHRRVDRPGHRGIDRRVGTLHAAGSLRWRATRVGRGVPQRRRHRRHPGRGDQLPELRFPRTPA